jgi:hypothetical protein
VFDIVAELAGFAKYTRQGVEARAGVNLTLDIVLTLGRLDESITVRGESPLLETQKPIQAVNIAGDFLRMLPLSTRRDLTDALEVTPGVTARNLIANNGTQTYMLRGTDVEQHVVQIDGADMVTSRQGRMETVRLPTYAVADSQVKTGGADASAPAGLGVVFNVTTKVGTNRLSGTAGVHYQNRGWNANNDPLGVPAIAESSEVEASLGGPIKVDRAWFFASYFYLHRNSQISRTPTQLNNLRASIPGWQPFDNRSRHHTGFIKVNAQVGSRHQLHGFFLKPRGFEEANASTDSRRFSPSGTTGNGVAGRLYSAWTNRWRLVPHVRRQDVARCFRGPGLRRPASAHLRLDQRVGGTAGRQRSARHRGQQPELQRDPGQEAHRASRRELVPHRVDGFSRVPDRGLHAAVVAVEHGNELPQWGIHPGGGPTARSRGPDVGLHSLPPSGRGSGAVGDYH